MRLLFGLLFVALTVTVPGLLLVRALAPRLPRGLDPRLALTAGLLVVPVLAMVLTLVLRTRLNPGLLVGVGAGVTLGAALAARLRTGSRG